MSRAISSGEMRVLEINSIALGVPTIRLMEAAGAAVAREVERRVPGGGRVAIFAGKGGNGGDGIVAARHLASRGYEVDLILTFKPSEVSHPDTAENLKTAFKMRDSMSIEAWIRPEDYSPVDADVIVDAVLGVGVKGKLREPVRRAVETINGSSGLKLAVDVPTGLDPDTGRVEDIAVKADVTVAMHAAKPGLLKAAEYVGELVVAGIGIPPEAELYVGPGDVEVRVPKKPKTAHKGVGGRVLIVGGSELYTGAPALAALSALRSGADLAVVAAPEKAAYTIASYSPNLIVKKLEGERVGSGHVDEILSLSKRFNSVIIGPGLGLHEETMNATVEILEGLTSQGTPVVVDADGLKAMAKTKTRLRWRAILTPHAGEAALLSGEQPPDPSDVKSRVRMASVISVNYEATVLLKGPVDVIAEDKAYRLNRTGNPGMSVGGTGDVLSGIAGTLLARGMSPYHAAAVAAYVCGLSGDMAYAERGERITATDVIEYIPAAFRAPLEYHLKFENVDGHL